MLPTITTSSPYLAAIRDQRRPLVTARAREQLREQLSAHRERESAARILDEQRTERAALRAARADVAAARDSATIDQLTAGGLPDEKQLAARRRDQYRAALSYAMTAEEVLLACDQALRDARLPDDDDRVDTLGALTLHVFARHGIEPLRCDVGREWLRERARRIYDRISYQRERATGMRASAALVKQWQENDAAERPADDGGPDAVWYLAAGLPAPEYGEQLSAEQISARLQLTAGQRAALTLTLESEQRVTVALTDAENMAASRARAALRKVYPDSDALRCALRPVYGAQLAVDRAIGIMRQRAATAGSCGTVLPGRSLPMADQLRPILRPGERLTAADRVWTYGLTARDDRAAR